ncbi:hypothetical protein [Winogradskyella aurantia]|uniref:Tetratricopeptide repeat protein n=1 Tax=Winogradskyella aurantia TaxID=1915063 RepID=A0A265UUZ3_9FLAO|nr:hypothetical protein [Winogradskyella aurantia]OZV69128.1 hypothetical protein CA834_06625 [Winogradskyella aurantia]
MQRQDLTYLLQHPENVMASQTDSLSKTIKEYPYFQAIRAVYLKGLKQKESYKYNNALKMTAAHTTDRSVLFDYITSEVFNQNEISEQIKHNAEHLKAIKVNSAEDISVNKSVTIDEALKQHIRATEGVLDPGLFKEKPETKKANEGTTTQDPKLTDTIISVDVANISPEKTLGIGKPLEFDKNESHSFTEWLKITNFKPIDRKEEQEQETDEKPADSAPLNNKIELIDRFIADNPKIKPITDGQSKPKLVNNDDEQLDHLMTETLARIYLEQKNYDKAIQSYRILSLKYPEKSSFFAHQIKAVQELKENNKT